MGEQQRSPDVLGDLAQRARMVVANDEGDVVAAGEGQGLARSLADRGALVLYKMGRGGCDILDQGETTHVGIFEVAALKPFGAGDAFIGGVMSSLAERLDIAAAVRRGAAAAAMVVSRRGCAQQCLIVPHSINSWPVMIRPQKTDQRKPDGVNGHAYPLLTTATGPLSILITTRCP